ncbi:MAG: formate--phosphoribosylaminoimidazolecarboxamide ligase [Methanomassiliicoccus sp.]|nr:formate--phosphoribosylaminoimidazolecarboxamide ligase [Methanomassiliicoccus sp.]
MVPRKRIFEILKDYDPKDITIATLCSHTSLQLFNGAKKEGFKTLGLAVNQKTKFYDAFPLAKPDEFLRFDSYDDFVDRAEELRERNVIIIPHGSFVEYMGTERFEAMEVPTFGNRSVLKWEEDRETQRSWLESAGIQMPRRIADAKDIKEPVLVKYNGAKGGRGFFIAKDYMEFKMGIDLSQESYTIQEYVLGTRYYLHYFYSPVHQRGYRVGDGSLELMSMDRRDESNIDELYKLGSTEELKKHGMFPSLVVTGNIPIVIRESLLSKVFEMGENVIKRSIELFGGLIGPFCLESIVTDKLEFKVFEISCRIVAGTNPFITGSPYSDLIEPGMSTGQRIAREIKDARDMNKLDLVVS